MAHSLVSPPTRGDPPEHKMTYAEFLDWADEDTYAEWVDGDVVMMTPASDRHQDIADFLTATLRIYVVTFDLGWVRSAPFQMKLENGREPDLLFVRTEHLSRVKATYLDGPADLVVEIVSPESVGRDRGDKFYEYEAGGVPEYWLIDPQRERAEFYILDEEGRYRVVPTDDEGRYSSRVVDDFWLYEDWFWQEPLPSPLRVIASVAGVDPQVLTAFEQALRSSEEH